MRSRVAGPDRDKVTEQEILVQPVGLVVTAWRLRLLAAMPGIGEDDGVAGLRLADQSFPGGDDVVLARIVVEEAHHLFGAGPVQRLRHVVAHR